MKNEYNKIYFKYREKKGFLSIVIPVYKDFEGISITLNSLKKSSFKKRNYEIIVVNDGGNEDVREVCKNHCVKIIDIIPNGGSYNARNKGIEKSRGEIIVFVDADIEVDSSWLSEGANSFPENDYVGGPIIMNKSTSDTLADSYEIFHSFPVEKYLKRNNFLPTANLFVKREVFEEIGGFDCRLRSSGDLEFGDRVKRANFLQKFNEKVKVFHPPRGYSKLVKKIDRVSRGHHDLRKLYPGRFSKFKIGNLFFEIFIPPMKINWKDERFSIFERYFFVWWIKILKNYSMLRLYILNKKK